MRLTGHLVRKTEIRYVQFWVGKSQSRTPCGNVGVGWTEKHYAGETGTQNMDCIELAQYMVYCFSSFNNLNTLNNYTIKIIFSQLVFRRPN